MAPLRLEFITLQDIPAITELYYSAFNIPENLRMFPDTPGLRRWWQHANRRDLLHRPHYRFLKVVDTSDSDRMIAYAKWNLAAEKYEDRFPPWHEESDQTLCAELFGKTQEHREKVLDLDLLITHPEYRRQGAASMLVKWGCDLADQNQVLAYVDAYKPAAALYRKLGFVDQLEPPLEMPMNIPMIRRAEVTK
ncbi:GNAT family N-acetyltransferase [Aspergillus tanneri]|nr:uncharacterized protein ATNIH1004_011519 [Aspergillus tanneri]KAA8642574.1 hypothetical protein ATNIH1004_011519 [Aspergillus tanneri]